MICIKNRQNSQEGGTTFARHVQILPRHSLTNQKRFLCFNQEQITKELGPRVPQSPSLCPSCAKEKGSGVENAQSPCRRQSRDKRQGLWGREWTPFKPSHACAVKPEVLKSWSLEIDYSRAPCLGADQKARGLRERD